MSQVTEKSVHYQKEFSYIKIIKTSTFFFSSRRRHKRSKRDWSSDVCSSDLTPFWTVHPSPVWCRRCIDAIPNASACIAASWNWISRKSRRTWSVSKPIQNLQSWFSTKVGRSEERRVGREGRVGSSCCASAWD